MNVHPDLAWIVNQVDNDVVPIGKDLGIREAVTFLTRLADQHEGPFADGISDAASNVEYACSMQNEYMERVETVDPTKLDYDPTALLAAVAQIVEHAKRLGWSEAVEAARSHRDNDALLPEPIGEDGEDDDPDEHASVTKYSEGSLYAAQQLAAHFGVDPDPDWEPV